MLIQSSCAHSGQIHELPEIDDREAMLLRILPNRCVNRRIDTCRKNDLCLRIRPAEPLHHLRIMVTQRLRPAFRPRSVGNARDHDNPIRTKGLRFAVLPLQQRFVFVIMTFPLRTLRNAKRRIWMMPPELPPNAMNNVFLTRTRSHPPVAVPLQLFRRRRMPCIRTPYAKKSPFPADPLKTNPSLR